MENVVSKFPEDKRELYKFLRIRLSGQIESCPHMTANLANASALLNQGLKEINWVGFYLMEGGNADTGAVPGETCLYGDPGRKRCVRDCSGAGRGSAGRGCASVSWTYCLR